MQVSKDPGKGGEDIGKQNVTKRNGIPEPPKGYPSEGVGQGGPLFVEKGLCGIQEKGQEEDVRPEWNELGPLLTVSELRQLSSF